MKFLKTFYSCSYDTYITLEYFYTINRSHKLILYINNEKITHFNSFNVQGPYLVGKHYSKFIILGTIEYSEIRMYTLKKLWK